MIYYYQDPKTRDLIIYNSDEDELFFVERIKNIRMDIKKPVGEEEEKETPSKPEKKKSGWKKITPEKIEEIKRRKEEDDQSATQISEEMGISMMTVYKYLKED